MLFQQPDVFTLGLFRFLRNHKKLLHRIGEYFNPRSDPIPRSYTRPIVMPASFASC